jgi:hypothetical protein
MFSPISAREAGKTPVYRRVVPYTAKVHGLFSGGGRAARSTLLRGRRKFKYFILPQCAQRLRVPRGKGKHRSPAHDAETSSKQILNY